MMQDNYFALDKTTLYNNDCLVGMNSIKDKTFDIVVTSPPYNLGIKYGKYNDTISRTKYLDWIEQVGIMIKSKLKDNGSFFLNMGSAPTNPYGAFEVMFRLRQHFVLQNTIQWIKSIYVENESYGKKEVMNVGHYKPINGKRFLNDCYEYIFHFTKSGNVELDRLAIGVPYKDTTNTIRWNGNTLRCRGNVWYIPYKTIQSRDKDRPHPATFPMELAQRCIKLHGVKEDTIVLDPFMGIGNTALASLTLGVNCVGYEIDDYYYSVSIKLVEEMNRRQNPL